MRPADAASSATSAVSASARPGSDAATPSTVAALRAITAIEKPSFANRAATARPIPGPAPITTAVSMGSTLNPDIGERVKPPRRESSRGSCSSTVVAPRRCGESVPDRASGVDAVDEVRHHLQAVAEDLRELDGVSHAADTAPPGSRSTVARTTHTAKITAMRDPGSVAVLAYEGMSVFETGIVTEVFGLPAPRVRRSPGTTLTICAETPGPVRVVGGATLHTPHGLDVFADADTVIVPGVAGPVPGDPSARPGRRAAPGPRRGARASCRSAPGAFALAGAGSARRPPGHDALAVRGPACAAATRASRSTPTCSTSTTATC